MHNKLMRHRKPKFKCQMNVPLWLSVFPESWSNSSLREVFSDELSEFSAISQVAYINIKLVNVYSFKIEDLLSTNVHGIWSTIQCIWNLFLI